MRERGWGERLSGSTDFDVAGRAEAIRLALHYGKIEFEDIRFTREEFGEKKGSDSFPYGQLPVLEDEGKTLAQSHAIERYVAKKAGLYPEDAFQAALVDEFVDTLEDSFKKVMPAMMEKDEEKKKEMMTKLTKAATTEFYEKMAKRVESNRTKGPFVLGEKLSMADFVLSTCFKFFASGHFEGVPKDFIDHIPVFTEMMKAFYDLPEIKSYYADKE